MRSQSVQRVSRRRWIGRAAGLLLLLLALDYALYPRLASVGGRALNRGENGIWLRYTWYFGKRSEGEVRTLARQLHDNQIRYAYFHVRYARRSGVLRYHYPESARSLVKALRREAPDVKALAWVFAGNELIQGDGVGLGPDLADPAVRRRMVSEARWLVETCGFDGVQCDYEICEDGDPHFLALLRETREALPEGALLSAAVPIWLPRPVFHIGWREEYYARVARECDQLAVMCYDTGIYLPRAYAWLTRRQVVHTTRAAARGNPKCRILIGLPTYGRGGPSHHAPAENIRMGIKGVREGLGTPGPAPPTFAGIALFADYTTQPEEWATYRRLWLRAGH